jgi:hypothetical protein
MSFAGIRRWVLHYAYGCFAKSWNGAIAAAYAFIGQALGSVMDPTYIQVPTWRTAAYVFGVTFAITAMGYFKDNPLPNKLDHQP